PTGGGMSEQQIVDLREVTVRCVKDNGIQDTNGAWYNVSKFAKPAYVTIPTVGATVRLHLDRSGYVPKVEPLVAAPAAKPSRPSVTTTHPADVSVSTHYDIDDKTTKVGQEDRAASIARPSCSRRRRRFSAAVGASWIRPRCWNWLSSWGR